MTGGLMVCGTASDVGKSQVVAGLCRVLARRGIRAAPFKAQNMALNSFVTSAGHEIGRAQAMQALAAGAIPEVAMNPILLKPTDVRSSQVVVMGEPWQTLDYAEYHARKPELLGLVLDALADLRSRFDVVVCEGAGSPAEINLIDHDIVNLRIAHEAGLPAVIVGDIDRGGVFAALHGTVDLLPEHYRALVKGFVINKLRGDPTLLRGGLDQLRQRSGVPTLGVLPYLRDIAIDAEDSLALAGRRPTPDPASGPARGDALDVAVVRFPRISNFTDLDALQVEPGVGVRMVDDPAALGDPDLVILPGTKATVDDLAWLRERGFVPAISKLIGPDVEQAPLVLGICGGYQMLGYTIEDGIESSTPMVSALGWLDVDTRFERTKVLRQRTGECMGQRVTGYQIHHGVVARRPETPAWITSTDGAGAADDDGAVNVYTGRVAGTSFHGLFEADAFRAAFLTEVGRRRGKAFVPAGVRFAAAREAQFDRIADALEEHLDMAAVMALLLDFGAHA